MHLKDWVKECAIMVQGLSTRECYSSAEDMAENSSFLAPFPGFILFRVDNLQDELLNRY